MAGKWREVAVEEIASKIAMGPFGSDIKTDNFVSAGVPIIRGGNLTSGRFCCNEFVFLTEEKADELANANAFPDDIVITHRGTLGQVGLVPREPFGRYVVSQSQMKLTCDPELADPVFVYYFFKSPGGQHALLMNTSQTGVPAISQPTTSLKKIRFSLPPLNQQRAIAHILATLDDKIELIRRTNQTLEGIAQAIFKSWFIDFDPVRAKMDGRKPFGMDDATATLFPDSFEDSELEEIPKGWRTTTVDNEFNLTMGQSPPGETYNDVREGVPFFQGRTDFGFRYPKERIFCTAPSRFANAGDTLVSVRAPVGSTNMAAVKCSVGRGVAAVRHKSGSRSYTYYFMRSLEPIFTQFEAEGTVFGSIGKTDFHAIKCIAPPPEVVKTFENLASPIDQQIQINEEQSSTLAVLRDTLLPKLLSGQIRAKS